jgi:hypothetical protein
MKEETRNGCPSSQRGSSLVEVLIALLIMLFLMIGILQMFSLAYLQNLGSAARTEMTYRCQQLTENMRFLNYLAKNSLAVPTGTNMTLPITGATTSPVTLPYTSSEISSQPYWGPDQSGVVSAPDMPYRLDYQISDGGDLSTGTGPVPGFWIVTVSTTPNQSTASQRYMGLGISRKRVDYVSQIPK